MVIISSAVSHQTPAAALQLQRSEYLVKKIFGGVEVRPCLRPPLALLHRPPRLLTPPIHPTPPPPLACARAGQARDCQGRHQGRAGRPGGRGRRGRRAPAPQRRHSPGHAHGLGLAARWPCMYRARPAGAPPSYDFSLFLSLLFFFYSSVLLTPPAPSSPTRTPFFHLPSSSTSTMASISTGTLRGSALTPTADLACRPASPNTAPRNSLQPLTTLGCD